MTKFPYSYVLTHIFSDAEWSVSDGDYDSLVWMSEAPKPSKQSLEALLDQAKLVAVKNVRIAERNSLLAASDWTQLPDVPEALRLSWVSYRQALRDITSQADFPHNVTWPSKPE